MRRRLSRVGVVCLSVTTGGRLGAQRLKTREEQENEDQAMTWLGVSLLLVVLSLLILGLQCWVWLKTGDWMELPLWGVLEAFGLDSRALVEIEGWAGVTKILNLMLEIPTALCPALAATLVVWISSGLDKLRRDRAE